MPRLIVRGAGRPNRIFEIEGKVITIGRSSENHLQIDDLNRSRHHCEIHEAAGGAYELVDKDSRNGLFVNGRRVEEDAILRDGDVIKIGASAIIYTLEDTPDVENVLDTYRKKGERWRSTIPGD